MAMFDPSAPMEDLQVQQQRLEQQRQMADMLRKRADQSQQPQGQMVGGRFIRPNIFQQLVPLLNQAQASYAQNDLNGQTNQFSQGISSATNNWESSLPKATAAQPALAGPQAEYGSPELDAKPAVMPDRASVLKATLAGMRIPGNANAAMLWNKGMGEDITREDNQQDKREARADTLSNQARMHTETVLQRADDAKRRSEDMRLSVEQRAAAAAEAAEARRYAADTMKAIANLKLNADKPSKPLPTTQANALVGNNSALRNIDTALALVKSNPKAFGAQNYLGDDILQRLDPKGVEARAKVADIGGLKIHERSGSAVTTSENARLKPYIPNATDNPETVIKKLTQLREQYVNNNSEIADFANMMGYIVPNVSSETRTPVGGGLQPPPGLQLPPGATYVGPAP